MSKEAIRCSECEHCKEFISWRNKRSEFSCEHPDQEYIGRYFKEHNIRKAEGFLNFGKPGEVPLKTSPAWCPKKRAGN